MYVEGKMKWTKNLKKIDLDLNPAVITSMLFD